MCIPNVGTYSRRITNFQVNQTSSSTVRLSWDHGQLTRLLSVTTVGYFVSYGRVDHGVKENIIVKGGSTTSVDLSNLHTGVEYEATIRGFSEDSTVRRVSTPVAAVMWTFQELGILYTCIVLYYIYIDNMYVCMYVCMFYTVKTG